LISNLKTLKSSSKILVISKLLRLNLKLISMLQNVLNFQISMTSLLHKAGEEIETMEAMEEEAEVEEEVTVVVEATAVAVMMEEAPLGEEEEEVVVEVEEAEEDMEIEMGVVMEVVIEVMTEEVVTMTITRMEASEVEDSTEEETNIVTEAVTDTNQEMTTIKASPDLILPNQLSEAVMPNLSVIDFKINLFQKLLELNVLYMLVTSLMMLKNSNSWTTSKSKTLSQLEQDSSMITKVIPKALVL
jgi:hypothetical protein